MNNTIKTNIQILAILLVAIVLLICLSFVVGSGIQPQVAVAQAPLPSPSAARNAFTAEKLAAYGLSLQDIQAAALYDLKVEVTANAASVPSGGAVVFTVKITNLGPTLAQYILFSQSLPPGMTGGTPNFGSLTAISDGKNPPSTWLITNAIPPAPNSNNFIQFTVSGNLGAKCNAVASYKATADAFNASNDAIKGNNTAIRSVNVTGSQACLFLPLIQKFPTPTPNPVVFFDDFGGNKNWPTADDSNCDRTYVNNEYEIRAKSQDEDCFSPAPSGAEKRYGRFKVKVRRDSGSSDFTVGIYINGAGADNYYLFQVNPADSCGWELIRRKDGNSDTKRSGGCDGAINRNSNSNTLEIRHTSNGDIRVFINGTQLGSTYNDGSQLSGTGTGVYARTNNSDDVVVRFDDFTVNQP